jgi:hypothetical protein
VWQAIAVHRSRAGVDAVLAFERHTAGFGAAEYRRMSLVVKRRGKTVYDHSLCSLGRCGIGSHHSLSLQDVWGDRLPEAVVDVYTGGAHCCFESLIVLVDGAHPGRAIFHDWGDPGYEVQRHGGSTQFVTADDRFAYAFTAFAASGLPVQVWTIDANGVLTNVTSSRPDLVRKDAERQWHAYTSLRGKSDSDVRGVVAAWCADEYRLGLRKTCHDELARALAAGHLGGVTVWPRNGAFVTALERSLSRWGY